MYTMEKPETDIKEGFTSSFSHISNVIVYKQQTM